VSTEFETNSKWKVTSEMPDRGTFHHLTRDLPSIIYADGMCVYAQRQSALQPKATICNGRSHVPQSDISEWRVSIYVKSVDCVA